VKSGGNCSRRKINYLISMMNITILTLRPDILNSMPFIMSFAVADDKASDAFGNNRNKTMITFKAKKSA